MLGASDVGKSLLTSQFMSSNDVSTYNHDDVIGKLLLNIFFTLPWPTLCLSIDGDGATSVIIIFIVNATWRC